MYNSFERDLGQVLFCQDVRHPRPKAQASLHSAVALVQAVEFVRFPTQRLGRSAHALLPENMATAMSESVDEGLLQEAINFALAKTNMTHIELKKEQKEALCRGAFINSLNQSHCGLQRSLGLGTRMDVRLISENNRFLSKS